MECPYLSRNSLMATIGSQPPPGKHFTLRRKPKSAALKAELFQKATESLSGNKRGHSIHTGSSAIVSLKRSDSGGKSPLKHSVPLLRVHSKTVPSSGSSSALRTLSAASLKQQNRTAKLLDINEQPIGGGVREAKRRKKMIAAEAENLLEEDRKKKEISQEKTTPEYAIGLSNNVESSEPAVSNSPAVTATSSSSTPSYAIGLNTVPRVATLNPSESTSQENLSTTSANFTKELQMHIDRERENIKLRRLQTATAGQHLNTGNSSFKSVSLQPPSQTPSQPSLPSRQPTSSTQPSVANPTAPKQELKLTREQVIAAQEMFRDANKVTKAEKSLILGFMAGSRENPYPDQGPVITVRLSEHTEISTNSNMNTPQTQLVEMLFEMNYDTGHWRRLKRTRIIARQSSQVNQNT